MNCPACSIPLHTQSSPLVLHPKNDCLLSLAELRQEHWLALSVNPWRDALTDAAICSWVLNDQNKDDPRKMIADLLAQERLEALDPAISEEASKLVAQARREGAEAVLQALEAAPLPDTKMVSRERMRSWLVEKIAEIRAAVNDANLS